MGKYICLICSFLLTTSAFSEEVSWDELTQKYIVDLSLSNNNDYVNSYMQHYNQDEWAKYRNNEFEFDDKLKETSKKMNALSDETIGKVYDSEVYYFLSKYDFNQEEFPARLIDSLMISNVNHWGNFPSIYNVNLSNAAVYEKFRIDKEHAKKLVSYEFLESNGTRNVPAKIFYKISSISKDGEVEAEIVDLVLYQSNRREKNIVKSVTPSQDIVSGHPSQKKIKTLVRNYYDKQSEWAGKYRIDLLTEMRIEKVNSSNFNIHVKYKYDSLGSGYGGRDKRVFHLKKSDSKWMIVGMGSHNSATFN
ncbi:hypothetical protein MACH09_45430 [Vibrio sp. MACH09]|uniref:DUF4852 domain-containing protein n=1 Tax=Vibrio sp. MACH09 TaxID=3025122 RepID=UPI0027907D8D|nr:DUF4852 domain-containing protein [Vibrio sp. MACH09]GLO64035.1 hypothetical protein MACH09_45430 [Vibrio sp. MACH09]